MNGVDFMFAQPSVYYGNDRIGPILTRSKLEAQWLSTLDSLNIPFQFEKERFIKPQNPKTGRAFAYLPDIFLPLQNLVLEVKGQFSGNMFALTDAYCLWHGKNKQLFEDMRQCLEDPSSICFQPDEESYVDVWAVEGRPNACNVMQFARIQKDVDCFDQMFFHVVDHCYNHRAHQLGVCPVCSNLVLFNSKHLQLGRNDDDQISVDCTICGKASFWPMRDRKGLSTYSAASHRVTFPFAKAAAHACSNSAKISKANPLNPEGTKFNFKRWGKTLPEQLEVPADLFTQRRGVV
jgi:hypothetical protein